MRRSYYSSRSVTDLVLEMHETKSKIISLYILIFSAFALWQTAPLTFVIFILWSARVSINWMLGTCMTAYQEYLNLVYIECFM
jgi:hypothetical protein